MLLGEVGVVHASMPQTEHARQYGKQERLQTQKN
jgi:hypothetical protein